MATPKKNNIVKSPISSMGLTFESGNPAEYPIAYSDNIWDLVRAATSPNLADTLGVDGQYDQHTINEVLAEKISLLAAVVAALRLMSLAVVQTLPTENISTTTIYLTPKSPSGDNNVYDEYVYINGDWEKIGDTELDLSGYAVQADIDYLQAAIERVDSSIPQNVSDLQDSDDYVKGSDLATVATSGSYDDLNDKPDLAAVATSGSYDDLNDKPTIPENISDLNNDSNFVESSDLATVATSGSYNDLEDKPDLSGYAVQADIDYLQAAIERVDSSIPQNVSDLQDSDDYVKGSDLATVATSGSYDDLNDKPDLAAVATSGSYDDLNDKPTIPENISDLNNDSNFVESSDLATVATSGSYDDLNDKPDLATVATSGSYDDLNDKPDLSGYAEQADIDYLQAAIEDLGNRANHYVFICKNYAESTSVTISAATHGRGYYPIVSCYSGGQQVAVDIALNEYGDITVGWKNAADVTPQNPMTISVMGAAEITADEEEQP